MITTIFEKLSALSLNLALWALVVTILLAVLSARRASRIEREENYIQLELASNELFRFEATHAANIEPFLSTNKPENVPEGRSTIRAFLFQTLSLFEIAVRLRREDRFGQQAFGTWVIWFYDTHDGWFFRQEWPELRENYTAEIRGIFDQMVAEFDPHKDPNIRKQTFFAHVATNLNCPIIKNWINDLKTEKYFIIEKKSLHTASLVSNIRLASIEDRPLIAELMATAIQTQNSYISHGDYFAGRSSDANNFVPNLELAIADELGDPDNNTQYALAVSTSGDVVGCAAFYLANNGHQDYCVLDDIVVPAVARSQGVGAALYDFVVQYAQQSNARKILLESGANNHSAHRFFDERGFKTMSKTFFKDL